MVGCLYISEFPAWALRAQQPGRQAVAVYHAGRIIARSRFLCQSGMLLGDSLGRARALFPKASFFGRDVPFEQAAWDSVLQHINDVTPFLESLERGVAIFKPSDFSEACALARQLVARIGLGPHKTVARIAALRSAPGSVLQIREDAVARFFSHTSIAVLTELGFNKGIPARLELLGLTSLDRVHALTKQHLQVQFGAEGAALFDFLHPSPDASRVPTFVPAAAITESFYFDSGTSDSIQLSRLLNWLVRRTVLRLSRSHCTRLALRLQPIDDSLVPVLRQRALKSSTSDPDVIGRAASHLLRSALIHPFEVASIGLTLSGLESPRRTQASLFFSRPSLNAAVEHLDERFPGAIRRALLVYPDAPFPEDRVRLVPFSE